MHYYVYTLAYLNGVVFYVGKGSGNRIAQHEKEALRGHNCPKCDLIRSIWRDGGVIQRALVFGPEDERAALDREAALLHHYGLTHVVERTFDRETSCALVARAGLMNCPTLCWRFTYVGGVRVK